MSNATRDGDGARRERLGWIALVGVAAALYSHHYDRYRLPPRLPGSLGLVLGGDVLPLLVVPALFARFVLREPLARFGMRWPGWRALVANGALAFAALLPFVVWFSSRPEFQAFYPSPAFPPARQHAVGLAFLWLLHHAPQLFATEFCFRGFLLFPLARGLGFARAVVVQAAPYVLLHADKPPLELAQAAWGAVVFAWVAWRTGSFLPAFAAHWAVAVAMDALCFLALRR
jgi:membrane protease YdiL (CAAX protease family)